MSEHMYVAQDARRGAETAALLSCCPGTSRTGALPTTSGHSRTLGETRSRVRRERRALPQRQNVEQLDVVTIRPGRAPSAIRYRPDRARTTATGVLAGAPRRWLWTMSTATVRVVSMARDRHQRKQVETALRFAEQEGCRIEVRHSGHTWGHVAAPNGQQLRVWSTPKNADVAARMIRRFVLNNKEE